MSSDSVMKQCGEYGDVNSTDSTSNHKHSNDAKITHRLHKCPICRVPKLYHQCSSISPGTRRTRDDIECPICGFDFDENSNKCFSCETCCFKSCESCIQNINKITNESSPQFLNGNDEYDEQDNIFNPQYDSLEGIQQVRNMAVERDAIRNYDQLLETTLKRRFNSVLKNSLDELIVDGFASWYPGLFEFDYSLDEYTGIYTVDEIEMDDEFVYSNFIKPIMNHNDDLVENVYGPETFGLMENEGIPSRDNVVQFYSYITQAKYHVYTDHEYAQDIDRVVSMAYQCLVDYYIIKMCFSKLLELHLMKQNPRRRKNVISEQVEDIQYTNGVIHAFLLPLKELSEDFRDMKMLNNVNITQGELEKLRAEMCYRLDYQIELYVELSKIYMDMKNLDYTEFTNTFIECTIGFNHTGFMLNTPELDSWTHQYRQTVEYRLPRILNV